MSPHEFASTLRSSIERGTLAFTAGRVDEELVVSLYRKGFVGAYESVPLLSLAHNVVSLGQLGFGASREHVHTLIGTLRYLAQHCTFAHGPVQLSMEGNAFSKQAKAALSAAVKGCEGLTLHL